MTDTTKALEDARKLIKEQDDYLKSLTDAALLYGTVIDADGADKLVVASGSNILQVNKPKNIKLSYGDEVKVHPETKQIIQASKRRKIGAVALLQRDIGGDRWEISQESGAPRIAILSDTLAKSKVETGDLVILDASGSVIVDLLPKKEDEFGTDAPNVKWEDIGGNERAKQELREAIDLVRGGNFVFTSYGATAPKGLLFAGPPGCGKTLLGKAAATELAKDGSGAFLYVKATELLSMYVGQSEARIRGLFQQARNFHERTNQTPLVFIDEADAILQKRGSGISSDVEKTIVPAFLTEMDGMEAAGALTILATNRPDTLDPAVIRDGRIDRRITVERPNKDVTRDIFNIYLRNLPIKSGQTADEIAEAGSETIFQPGGPLISQVSGALVAGVVDRAKRRAVRRDIQSKGAVSGISREDVTTSILEANMEIV